MNDDIECHRLKSVYVYCVEPASYRGVYFGVVGAADVKLLFCGVIAVY